MLEYLVNSSYIGNVNICYNIESYLHAMRNNKNESKKKKRGKYVKFSKDGMNATFHSILPFHLQPIFHFENSFSFFFVHKKRKQTKGKKKSEGKQVKTLMLKFIINFVVMQSKNYRCYWC